MINKKLVNNLVVVAIAVLAGGFIIYSFKSKSDLSEQLNSVLNDTLKEKEQLQESLSHMEQTIGQKEEQLRALSNAQSLRDSLDSAQATIGKLNQDLDRVNREKIALQDAQLGASGRLQSTTKEYMRTLEETKTLKAEIARLNKEKDISFTQKRIEELNKSLEAKNQELLKQKAEFEKIKSEYQTLHESNRDLEKRIKELDQGVLQSSGQAASLRELQNTIAELKNAVQDKEAQIRQLQGQAEKGRDMAGSSSGAGRLQRLIDDMTAANKDLKAQLADLNDELIAARKELKDLRAGKGAAGSQEQVNRLSEILMKKELEIDKARKEAMAAQEQILVLQSKVAQVEGTLNASRVNLDKIRELESERISMQSRVNEMESNFNKKKELADSLQKNVDYLTQQLSRAQEEKKSAMERLSRVDSSAREDVDRERSRSSEINVLYNSLKTQVAQYAETLTQKEMELEQKRQDMALLRDEMGQYKLRADALEKELADVRERQKKTLDDLVMAMRLNSALQERLMGISPSAGSETYITDSEAKKKAEDLRRRIEVILEPEKR
jgi:chromosome segregation ATPase